MCNRMFPIATCGRILRIRLQTSIGKYIVYTCARLGTVEVFQAGLIDSNVIEDEAVIAGLGIGNLVLNHVFSLKEGRRRRRKKKKKERERGGGGDAAGVEG